MGLLDSLTDLSGLADKAKSELNVAKNIVLPQEIQNLQITERNIVTKLTELETRLTSGATNKEELGYVRTYLVNHFGNIMQGGEPDPCEACKAHPAYAPVRDNYQVLQNRLAVLEKEYAGCTFGYKLADGSIQVPSTSWTTDQWGQYREQSTEQVARCWLDSDPSSYF